MTTVTWASGRVHNLSGLGGGRRLRNLSWLVWRQHRPNILFMLGVAVAGSVCMLWNARVLASVSSCNNPDDGTCLTSHQFAVSFGEVCLQAAAVVPLFIGAFVGGPLIAREYEQGTFTLAWTQDISLRRWLIAKISLLSAAFAVILVPLTFATNRVSRELNRVEVGGNFRSKFGPTPFESSFPLTVAYALFGLALGVGMGILLKRVLPSVGATIVAFILSRAAVRVWLRPHYLSPERAVGHGADPVVVGRNSLILTDNAWGTSSGALRQVPDTCNADPDFMKCALESGVSNHVSIYQPGSRLIIFQAIEFGIFSVLALILVIAAAMWAGRTNPRIGFVRGTSHGRTVSPKKS